MTILVVDDEQDIRTIVRIALRTHGGWNVIEAECGPDALEVLARVQVDAVLLDVMMPGMDGGAVLQSLRQEPRTAHLPVIFLTAKAGQAELERLHGLGAQGVITKPFDPMRLPRLLQDALDQSSSATTRPSASTAKAGGVFKPEALSRLWGLPGEKSGSLVAELIELFATNTPATIRRLQEAAHEGAARDVERLAHSIKGSASTLGATEIADMARSAEGLASQGRVADAAVVAMEIERQLPQALGQLQRLHDRLARERPGRDPGQADA